MKLDDAAKIMFLAGVYVTIIKLCVILMVALSTEIYVMNMSSLVRREGENKHRVHKWTYFRRTKF